jgi:serine/threonine protein phosphatase 1
MNATSPRVVRHGLNEHGRDFVMADIHGTYEVVAAALRGVRFDWARDRLFSVGDLVDRGPESRRALPFIRNPRINPILGNHEDMFLEMYESTDTPPEAVLRYVTSRNGMGWWMDLTQAERMEMIHAFRSLPIAMEIETARGMVGLTHAEVPHGMDWQTFTTALEAGDPAVTKSAIWGRTRITRGDDSGVRGIDRVFSGHSIVDGPTQLGNVYLIDSGSFVGVATGDAEQGRLVIADLISGTQTFRNPPSGEFFDVRAEYVDAGRPFGSYAS